MKGGKNSVSKKSPIYNLLTSTLVGQHSTALLNMICASSGPSSSTAAFQILTEFGMCSKAKGININEKKIHITSFELFQSLDFSRAYRLGAVLCLPHG